MLISTENLIKRYYDSIKDTYPELSFSEVNAMCRSPFSFLRAQMRKATLPSVRFKHLGVFLVKEKRASSITLPDKGLESGKITPRKYEKIRAIIEHQQLNQNKQ